MTRPVVDDFRGQHRWLSNFHLVKVQLGEPFVDGLTYPSTEHAYQAAKSDDPGYRASILACRTPGDAKRLSATPKSRALTRPDWQSHSLQVMLDLLRKKFRYPDLKEKLLATGDALLVEGNVWHDNFWGDCRCGGVNCGDGKNYLGKHLMRVRAELRFEDELRAIYQA